MTPFKAALVALTLLSLVSCAKKQKPDTDALPPQAAVAPEAPPVMDTDIQGKDLSSSLDQTSDSGKIAGLYTLNFQFDKSTLTPDARKKAALDAQYIKSHPAQTLQIEGHCDRVGSTEYNLALGERRANAVKKYLLDLGVDSSKLTTISYGKERLLSSDETEAADAKNRRANFRVSSAPVDTHQM